MTERPSGVIHAAILIALLFAFLQVALLAVLIHAITVNSEIHEGVYQSNKMLIEEVEHLLSVYETVKIQ